MNAQAGPVILVVTAIFGRARARRWRRMEVLRDVSPLGVAHGLARGDHQVDLPSMGPSTLERLCGAGIWLGVIATPYWLGAMSPLAWVGGAILIFWIARAVLLGGR